MFRSVDEGLALPSWAGDARRAHVAFGDGPAFEVLLADDAAKRRVGLTRLAAGPEGTPAPVLFAFDLERFHGFWGRGVPFDLDLVQLDRDGVVVGVARIGADSAELVHPPRPIAFALQLAVDRARRLGATPGAKLRFDPEVVRPRPPRWDPEPSIIPDAADDPALVVRWSAREHAYSSRAFATAGSLMGWRLRVAPGGVALWLHAGGAFVLHPPIVPLAALDRLTRTLGLAWLRLELAPHCRLLMRDGTTRELTFDPRDPDRWLAEMHALGLTPTSGRWQQTRTLVVDLAGPIDAVLARLPTRIRYEARAFQRQLDTGELRVDRVPGARFDARQARAFAELHGAWLARHPDAEDNMDFCRPVAHGYGDGVTAWLCWRGPDLVAAQIHILWRRTLYYLFSETIAGAPASLTPGLLWHGISVAKRAPDDLAPDLLDLVGAFDPRYPDYRAFGKGFTASKLRWHPTSVYLPPSVAIPGLELPP